MSENITDYKLYKAISAYDHKWVEGYPDHEHADEKKYMWVVCEEVFVGISEPVYGEEEIIPETLCEFTGFSDTYGNKIFENDKVTVFTPECSFPLNDSIVFKNKEDDEWYYKHVHIFLGKKKITVQPLNSAKYLRVTGNKFD